jgi:hypothetical protein
MTTLANNISSFIESQLPGFIRENNPGFSAFLKAYYSWMETNAEANNGAVLYHANKLLDYRLIDSTTDDFITYFKRDFLPFFPDSVALDEKKLLKSAAKFYNKKGSEESIKFLFRVLYNKDAEIYYPKKNILKTSDGKWNIPRSLKLTLSAENSNFDVNDLVGHIGIGSESNTSCVIESVNKTADPQLNREIVEIYISQINRSFTTGENLEIVYGFDSNNSPLVFTEKIIGSISSITIDPNRRGLRYVGTIYNDDGSIQYQGDPVVLVGGLAETPEAIEAVAYVGNVTSGQLQSITVTNGGYGYRVDPNTIVHVVPTANDTGVGAEVIVQTVDTTNQVFVLLNTDSIDYKGNTLLSAANYHFANVANSNINSIMANVWSFSNTAIAPLRSLNVVEGGGGYREVPTLNLLSVFNTDFSNDLYSAYLLAPSQNNYNLYSESRAAVRDIGRIAAVLILNGGSGYSNTRDAIYFNSSIGYGANLGFTTNATGTITSILINQPGFGYLSPKPDLFVANSSNRANTANGTGAILRAIGDNEGEEYSISVSDIGRIQSIRLVNRGFDYISTPDVSLRIQDVTITAVSNNDFFIEGEPVFQGPNVNSATFIAYVDSYDRANAVLRIYDYIGTVNLGSNINTTNAVSSLPLSVTIYGNGKANANAEFLNGLIEYPGFYLNTDGFLSSDQFIQDDVKYHNYSYVVKVEEALRSYKDTLMQIAHPAGTKLLGLYTLIDEKQKCSKI